MDIVKNAKCCANCWYFHKGKHKALDEDGILRDFDGICSELSNVNLWEKYALSVFNNNRCDNFCSEIVVIKRLARKPDDEQKTLDNIGD